MSNLLTAIQSIAVNAVRATNPVEYCIGTVTSIDPLKVRLNESTLEVWGDVLMLTSAVVERKMTIKKHHHAIVAPFLTHTHTYVLEGATTPTSPPVDATQAPIASADVQDTVLDAYVNEFGASDPLDHPSDENEIVVTLNRGLKKDDKVLMLQVCGGQKFIILSRLFPHTDDEE